MNNTLKIVFKIILTLLVIGLLLVGGVIAYFAFSMNKMASKAKEDGPRESSLCDTIKVITERPEISFSGFSRDELESLRFSILRDGEFVQDTLVRTQFNYENDDINSGFYGTMQMPYTSFLKTDTIVVETEGGLYFYLSGYHHYAYLHYGMFGYLGSSDCRFSESCMVNGEQNNYKGTLAKSYGWKRLGEYPLRLYKDTPQFEAYQRHTKVKLDESEKILVDKTNSYIFSFLFYEGGNYIFSLREHGSMKIVKINTTTGNCVIEK